MTFRQSRRKKGRAVLGDAGDPRFAERTPPWFGKKRKSEHRSPTEIAEADVQAYEQLGGSERTRLYYEFKKRIDAHRDAEVRRTGSRGASWEGQIVGKFDGFYERLAVLFEAATGRSPD